MKLTLNYLSVYLFARLFHYPITIISNLYGLIILVSVIWTGGNVQAKEIYLQPSLNIRSEYDTNKRLRIGNDSGFDKSAYGVITRANAKLGIRSERYDIALDNEFILNRYSSDFNLDSEDINIKLNSNYEATENLSFALNGNYKRDTTLTSELDENGTGLIQNNLDREQWAVTPVLTYSFSETQFFQASYTHNEVNYEESTSNQFFDFTTDILSLSFSQQWTESLRNFISVSAMSFLVPELRRETTEYSVNAGVDYQISPTWSTSLTIGRRFTNIEITSTNILTLQEVMTSVDTEGMVFSFSLNKQLETGHASASYSRSTSAQGNGQQRLVDSFNFSYRHQATERLDFSLRGGINITSNSGGQTNVDERMYYSVTPSAQWHFNHRASVSIGYRYRTQEFERQSESAESHSVFVNFNYQWDKLSTQRY